MTEMFCCRLVCTSELTCSKVAGKCHWRTVTVPNEWREHRANLFADTLQQKGDCRWSGIKFVKQITEQHRRNRFTSVAASPFEPVWWGRWRLSASHCHWGRNVDPPLWTEEQTTGYGMGMTDVSCQKEVKISTNRISDARTFLGPSWTNPWAGTGTLQLLRDKLNSAIWSKRRGQ
jgi:hypothetical protein